MRTGHITKTSGAVEAAEEYNQSEVEFALQELQTIDSDLQLHAVFYLRSALQKPYGNQILNDYSEVVIFLIAMAQNQTNPDIKGIAIEALSVAITLSNCSPDPLESSPGFCESLYDDFQSNPPWIQGTIAIITYLFAFEKCREIFLQRNIISIIPNIPVEIDTSSLILQIFRFCDFDENIRQLIQIVFAQLEFAENNNIPSIIINSLTTFTSIVRKFAGNEFLNEIINLEVLHSKILQFLASDDKEIVKTTLYLLECLGQITAADIEACLNIISSNSDSASNAARFLDKTVPFWAEAFANQISKFIVENVFDQSYQLKRVLLTILSKICMYITDLDERLPEVFQTFLSDQLIARQLINGLYDLVTRTSTNPDFSWFNSAISESIDDIEALSLDRSPTVAEKAKQIMELL